MRIQQKIKYKSKITALNSNKLLFICILILTWSFFSTQAIAQQNLKQSHDSLYQIALDHLKQKTDQKLFNPKFNVQRLSHHIQFPVCQVPLELIDRNPGKITGRNTFNIFCDKPQWRVTISATVGGDLPVVIATQGILRQEVIKEDDIKQILVPFQRVRTGGFTDPEQVIGLRAKRSIGPNTILTIRLVQPPYWVFKNRQVTLVTQVGNIKIETKGIALKSGVEKEQVAVRNLSSQKIIKGIVIAPNTVKVP